MQDNKVTNFKKDKSKKRFECEPHVSYKIIELYISNKVRKRIFLSLKL